MKFLSEKTYHILFWIGIIVKGIISIGEITFGIAFYVWDYPTLLKIAFFLTGDELTEAPRDVFWRYAVHGFNGFLNTPQAVWAFIFLWHGIIKTLLTIGIVKDMLWVYPVSAVIFGLFAIYQCYQFIYAPSFLLVAITAFDVVLIGLILHEYRHKRKLAVSG